MTSLANRFTRIFFVAVLLPQASAFAASPLPIPPPALLQRIETELLPYVRTMSRTVTLWHWTHRSDPGIPLRGVVPSNDPHFAAYLARRATSYFRMSPNNRSNAGTGLYLAIDPTSTMIYGGVRGGALIQMDLPAGTRTLEIGNGLAFSTELANQLWAYGCTATTPMMLFSSDSEPRCQSIRVAIARSSRLATVGIRYAYRADTYTFCTNRPTVAFNLWDPRALRNVVGFTLELDVRDPATYLRALIRAFFEDRADDADFADHLIPPPDSLMPSRGQVENFARARMVGCGNFPEDAVNQ